MEDSDLPFSFLSLFFYFHFSSDIQRAWSISLFFFVSHASLGVSLFVHDLIDISNLTHVSQHRHVYGVLVIFSVQGPEGLRVTGATVSTLETISTLLPSGRIRIYAVTP